MTAATRTGTPRTRAGRPATSRPALLIGTRVLLALFGLLKLGATLFFTFVASAAAGGDPQGIGDWSVAVWSIAVGAGYLVVAARLGRARVLPLAAGLAVADLLFGVVKLTVYGESATLVFMAASLTLLGLVGLAGRTRRD
jgi:hypothetical protein